MQIFESQQKNVSNLEKSNTGPSLLILEKLNKEFKINLNWMFGTESNIFLPHTHIDVFFYKKILKKRIEFHKKEKFNDFQSQIIILYRSIKDKNLNSKEDIIEVIKNHDISSIIDKFVELYSNFRLDERKTKDETIEFIRELSEPEINYIVAHKDDFIEVLVKDKDIFSRQFKKIFIDGK